MMLNARLFYREVLVFSAKIGLDSLVAKLTQRPAEKTKVRFLEFKSHPSEPFAPIQRG
jgi:hypothetical protein